MVKIAGRGVFRWGEKTVIKEERFAVLTRALR